MSVIKQQIMSLVGQMPNVKQAVNMIEAQLQNKPLAPQEMDIAINLLEQVLQDPGKYAQIRAALIKDGDVTPDQLPEQFDQVLVISILVALYELQDRGALKKATGGLVGAVEKVKAAGQGGDTELVHVNPREKEMLRLMGGAGTVNPNTGLHEYKGGVIGAITSVVAPVAGMLLAPVLAPVIGGALGIGSTAATALSGVATGALGSAVTGGNVAQGALYGGLGSGLGGVLGGAANDALGLGLSGNQSGLLGNALAGGLGGAATGQGFGTGAMNGVVGGMIGNMAGSSSPLGKMASAAGNAITAGYDPNKALLMGGMAGLTSSLLGSKPSDKVVGSLSNPTGDTSSSFGLDASGNIQYNAPTFGAGTSLSPSSDAAPGADTGNGIGGALKNAALLYGASQVLGGAPQAVQTAVSSLSPQEQAYFNRPSIKWNWDKMQQDATGAGQDLSQYMAKNWNKITGGQYNMAQGGALGYLGQGGGSGRSDNIDARLSPGEYVMDAETVSMLGDGSNQDGAKKLDEMRQQIRMHKGKSLAKGKFSPNAKSPLNYLKGVR